GGEPLLNKDCAQILEEVHKYENQITGSVDFVTNGTMEIPDDIISVLAKHRDKTKVVLSNYGENLSKKINIIEETLKQNGIPYRVSKFYGNDLYYDGWIDFSNHDLKWKTIEERDQNAQKCVHRVGKYFVINDGELHCCSRSYWRIRQGIIPKIKGEYVPLMDDTISIEEKRQDLIEMFNQKSSTSCAYCVGLCNGVPRVKPAQQL
ncbi:radical SAM protein, partial [uncultured Eubacterium sp.]|uniref:radical SAM protein n=1 Tax=uncultured Eubacterium sp. TaxID=165185 RepID=UPI002597AD16